MVQPYSVADDLGRKAIAGIGGEVGRHPASLARPYRFGQRASTWQCPFALPRLPPCALCGETENLRIVQRSEAFAVYSYINIGTFRNKWIVAGYSKATELQRPEAVILNSIEMEVRDQPVLDLGVGSGRTTPHLRRISSKYTGLDYSPEMIATCRRSYPGVDFLVGDARDLSAFEAGSFGL